MNLFRFFQKEDVKPPRLEPKSTGKRGFKGAVRGRFTNWLFSSFKKINQDLKDDLKELIERCRDLAKNNEVFRSHLNNLEKSIIGQQGFRLQSLVKADESVLDEAVNNELELAWWEFGKRSNGFITKDGLMGDKDLDSLVLRTLMIDRRGVHQS